LEAEADKTKSAAPRQSAGDKAKTEPAADLKTPKDKAQSAKALKREA
jgi:hypothetical protein